MKVEPIDEEEPTPQALAKGINQVHRCLETHRRNVDPKLKTLSRSYTRLRDGQGDLVKDVAAIKKALRIDDDGKSASVAAQRPWVARLQQAGAVGGGIIVALTFLRLVAAIWPQIKAAAVLILTTP